VRRSPSRLGENLGAPMASQLDRANRAGFEPESSANQGFERPQTHRAISERFERLVAAGSRLKIRRG
jgi:hypothetical protein